MKYIDPIHNEVIAKTERSTQVIIGALAMASLTLGFMFQIMVSGDLDGEPGIISYILMGKAVFLMTLSLIVPRLIANRSVPMEASIVKGDDSPKVEQACRQFQTKTIVGGAMLESSVMVCLMARFLDGTWIPYIPAGIALVMLISFVPMPGRVEAYVAEQIG